MLHDIDVIIPVYNGARYLEQAVDSVMRQTFPPRKIFIVDDGSTDSTQDIIKSLQDKYPIVEAILKNHAGVSAARNAGIKASSAPFLAFMDSDDEWVSEKLEKQMAVFRSASEHTGVVHCSYMNIDESGNVIMADNVTPPKIRGDIFHKLLFDHYVLSGSASAVLIKRSYLEKTTLFDERLFYGEDWDLWIRLAAICNYDFSPEPLVKIRVHTNSVQRCPDPSRALKFMQQHLIIFNKWYGDVRFPKKILQTMQNDACILCFPYLLQPVRIYQFYSEIKKSDIPLAKDLFVNFPHFLFVLICNVARLGFKKIGRCLFKRKLQNA